MIPLFKVAMDPTVDLHPLLQSGFIGQGPKVEEFEAELEKFIGRPVLTVNSGTSALHLAYRLAGVQDRYVISTPMTCAATNTPILANNGKILWADIDPRTGLIDPNSVADLVDQYDDIAAIVTCDWGGQPADYDELRQAALGIPIIEDAAHAFGAWYKTTQVGSTADYVIFSFQAIKHLTTGDGGGLCVPDHQYKRAKNLRWFGYDRDEPNPTGLRGSQDIVEWGYKFHMNDINATIGLANIKLVGGILHRHRAHAAMYDTELDERFTRTKPDYDHIGSWWLYTTLLPSETLRDEFVKYMAAQQVMVSQVHWRNDRLSTFAESRRNLPGVSEFTSRMVCLPTHWQAPARFVIETANRFWAK